MDRTVFHNRWAYSTIAKEDVKIQTVFLKVFFCFAAMFGVFDRNPPKNTSKTETIQEICLALN